MDREPRIADLQESPSSAGKTSMLNGGTIRVSYNAGPVYARVLRLGHCTLSEVISSKV